MGCYGWVFRTTSLESIKGFTMGSVWGFLLRSGGVAMGHVAVRGPLTQTLTCNCTTSGLLEVAPES